MTAALQCLALIAVLVAISVVTGRAVLAWCAGEGRTLTEATVVGAAVLVLWLCTLSALVPLGSAGGLAGVVLPLAALVAGTAARRRSALVPARAELVAFAGALAGALAVVVPVLLIVAGAGSTALVHLSGSHDGYFFTAVPEWLLGHRSVGGPGITAGGSPAGTPLYASVWDHYQATQTRIGGEVVTTSIARLTGTSVLDSWLPVTLGFQVLLGLGAQHLAARLGRPGWRAVVLGSLAAGSAHALGAVVDQHTPTLVALAFALVLVTEVERGSRAGRGRRTDWSPVVVAVLASGIAATYGELFALLAVPLAVLLAVRSVARRQLDWSRWATALAWCVPLAALPWWRAIGGASSTPAPAGHVSHLAASRGSYVALRSAALGPAATASTWTGAGPASRALVVGFAAALVVGLGLAVARGRARSWWAGLVAMSGFGWWWFGRWEHSGYPQERFTQWALPVLVLGATLGWATLADHLPRRPPGDGRRAAVPATTLAWRRIGAVAVAVVGTVAVAGPGLLADARAEDVPTRRIDVSYTDPAGWVAERDPTGSETVVWARDYTANLWTPFVLRDAPSAGYVSIYEDYYDVRSFGPMAGRRWLLLDDAARRGATLPPDAIAAANGRFALVDLRQGPVTVVVPPTLRSRWADTGRAVAVTFDAEQVRCEADDGEVLACA